MTGYDMVAEVKLILNEDKSSQPSLQLQLYQRHLQRAADELATQTWSNYYRVTTDIVSGQFEYCLPFPPYELRAVNVTDSGGAVWPIAAIRPEDMDENYWQWRSGQLNITGVPAFYIPEGLNLFRVYPVPDYDRTDALSFEGYFTISGFWDVSGECPLPDVMHETVVLGTAIRRCREMLHIPEYIPKLQQCEKDYQANKARLYRISMRANEAHRRGGPPSRGKRLGPWCLWGWNSTGGGDG